MGSITCRVVGHAATNGSRNKPANSEIIFMTECHLCGRGFNSGSGQPVTDNCMETAIYKPPKGG